MSPRETPRNPEKDPATLAESATREQKELLNNMYNSLSKVSNALKEEIKRSRIDLQILLEAFDAAETTLQTLLNHLMKFPIENPNLPENADSYEFTTHTFKGLIDPRESARLMRDAFILMKALKEFMTYINSLRLEICIIQQGTEGETGRVLRFQQKPT